jgi:hypothetical protein
LRPTHQNPIVWIKARYPKKMRPFFSQVVKKASQFNFVSIIVVQYLHERKQYKQQSQQNAIKQKHWGYLTFQFESDQQVEQTAKY